MKLAKYLADYIEHELVGDVIVDELQEIIQQGIEAFESTEQVRVRIVDMQQRELATLISLAKEFVEWAKDKSFCNSGQHICDRLANYFEELLV